ncbi:MAG: type II toxin-antitoxin system VapC family toxin [Chlamydiae bacterium]|nr:type II toxin-antitoxin system VapC family toxin [Chlamydiota bacterium]
MDWVLDCSFALSWTFPDERSESSERLLKNLSQESLLWVPSLWWVELSNAMRVGLKKKRLSEADLTLAMDHYGSLRIQTDFAGQSDYVWRLLSLTREYDLSAYDASYLELSQRKGLGLATLDRALASAAQKAGVKLALRHLS